MLSLGTVELGLVELVSARSIDFFDSKKLLIEGLMTSEVSSSRKPGQGKLGLLNKAEELWKGQ